MDFEAPEGVKFTFIYQCRFCSIFPLWALYHNHIQYPYVGTLNKIRENLEYEIITFLPSDEMKLNCFKKLLDIEKCLKLIDDGCLLGRS